MSIKIMSAVWDMDIPGTEKLILLALADFANHEGECWPSVRMLIKKTGFAERTVQMAVKGFVDSGIIERSAPPGQRSRYRFTPALHAPPHDMHPRTPDGSTPAPRAGDPRTTCGGILTVNEPPLEPSAKAGESELPPDLSAVDLVKVIFDTGLAMLTNAGQSPARARSIVGKWRKTHKDHVVLAALSRCQVEKPSEPVEWMAKALLCEAAIGDANGQGTATEASIIGIGRNVAARLAN